MTHTSYCKYHAIEAETGNYCHSNTRCHKTKDQKHGARN